MYVLYCLLHVNLEIRCKITKNVLYAQQFCVKNVLHTQQLYAKLNKNVIFSHFQ